MNCMKLEVKVISAIAVAEKNVYAKIYIDGEPSTEKQTLVDRRSKRNPKWNFSVAYTINRLDVRDNCTKLIIRLYSQQMLSDKYIGEVSVKFKELFKRAGRKRKTVKYKLRKGLGKSKGKLKFSYKFLDDKPSTLVSAIGCAAMAIFRIAIGSFLGLNTASN